ncbi:MAG: FG-GAP-like repeat-containing protein, partial [Candidatus Andersenbacteria bacterium]|nr:FG-GAP-like repeat-containing protein [Candidatus Andersenbacteria bacterium]
MKRKSSHGSRERVVLRARLRVRSRRARFSRVMPAVRTAVSLVLVVSLVISGWRWLIEVPQAGALEFTPHVVGESGSAVGVQGVAAYDIDGDGDRDIVTGGIDGIKIYANTGDFKFDLHVVSDKQSERVQIADLDGDGDGDILVNFKGDSPSVAWFKNNGDFEFSSQSLGGATGRDAVAAAGDINGDGAIDIITSGSSGDLSGPFVLRTWINNGSGTFSATVLNADSKVTAVAIGDLNHNGYKDIVTGGDDGLQRWDTSDGATWTRVDVDDSNANRTHIVVGDPENGSTWIATADDNVDELVLYKSGPTESSYTRYGRMVVANSIDAKTVATVDLNGDGNLDLLVADQDKNSVYWYENDGTGQFKSQQTIATNLQSVYGVAAADLDGDGDSDIVTADLQRGIVYAYERLRTKPSAMAPGEIVQSTTGSGAVQFTSEISDGDDDPTRIRVQYSVDGQHWYKPWLTKVTADNGSVDLVNKNGYQVGTVDHIDTDQNDSVKLTFTWDTKSTENTGGPISGDTAKVYLRIIPRDDRDVGLAAVSSGFRVDNAPPTGAGALRLVSIDPEKAVLSWNRATDSNTFVYKVYYGTDNTAVLELRSDVWDVNDDSDLDDTEATTTTITSLAADKYYTFKLVAEDNFGNIGAWPSVRGKTDGSTATVPVATPLSGATPTPSPTPATSAQVTGLPSITPTPAVSPKPAAPDLAPVLKNNRPPAVDAGPDQVVNPRALVILDGTASFDPDPGDT